MRSINYITKSAMLAGMVLVLSASPAMAFGGNKVEDEKAKVEMNKAEKAMLEVKKVEEQKVMELKAKSDLGVHIKNPLGIHRNLLLDEGIIGEGLLGEDLLGEELIGLEE